MKWIIGAVILLVGTMVVAAVIGLLLPEAHVATRSATLPAPPDQVFARIADLEAAPAWRPDVYQVERLPDRDGRMVFREIGEHGAITMEVVERQAPARLVTRVADPAVPFAGSWTYELQPAGTGTRLTITERGRVRNPILRCISRFVIGHHATIDAYLRALAAVAAQEPSPGRL